MKKIRMVNQSNLSSECLGAQIWGKEKCKTCEIRNTSECGGKNIIKTGKNDKGIRVPV